MKTITQIKSGLQCEDILFLFCILCVLNYLYAENLIKNSGFEEGLKFWEGSGVEVVKNTPGHIFEGASALYFPGKRMSVSVSQFVMVETVKCYQLDWRVKCFGLLAPSRTTIESGFYDANKKFISVCTNRAFLNGNSEIYFHRGYIIDNIPANTVFVKISISVFSDSNTGYACFDNIALGEFNHTNYSTSRKDINKIRLSREEINYYNERTIRVPRVTSPVFVDGDLSDSAWSNSIIVKPFFRVERNDANCFYFAVDQSEARFCYDDRFLYVSATCFKFAKDNLRSDVVLADDGFWGGLFGNDCVEIFICTKKSNSNKIHLAVNPVGALFDADNVRGRNFHFEWKVKTKIFPNYWIMESALPLEELSSELIDRCEWRINIGRQNYALNECSSIWPGLENLHMVSHYGELNWD